MGHNHLRLFICTTTTTTTTTQLYKMVQTTCIDEIKSCTMKSSRCLLTQAQRKRRNLHRMQQHRRKMFKTSRESGKKDELKTLFTELGAMVPSCKDTPSSSGLNVVLKSVDYINQLHRQVAAERGIAALQEIQNNARQVALQQMMKKRRAAE